MRGPQGVVLTRRSSGPSAGLWHLPGGTVRFGEPLADAMRRVAAAETGMNVDAGPLLGYIEYPSHYLAGLDSPVGIAFLCPVRRTAHRRGWRPRLVPECTGARCTRSRSRSSWSADC